MTKAVNALINITLNHHLERSHSLTCIIHGLQDPHPITVSTLICHQAQMDDLQHLHRQELQGHMRLRVPSAIPEIANDGLTRRQDHKIISLQCPDVATQTIGRGQEIRMLRQTQVQPDLIVIVLRPCRMDAHPMYECSSLATANTLLRVVLGVLVHLQTSRPQIQMRCHTTLLLCGPASQKEVKEIKHRSLLPSDNMATSRHPRRSPTQPNRQSHLETQVHSHVRTSRDCSRELRPIPMTRRSSFKWPRNLSKQRLY